MSKEDHTHTHIHTQDYYSVISKNQILPFATTQIDPEGIILRSEKDKYVWSQLYVESTKSKGRKNKKTKLTGTENRLVDAGG